MEESPDVHEVGTYDDLTVATSSPPGHVVLRCPTCGVLAIPRRATTRSDLTNAALEHLLEVHPRSLTLALGSSAGTRSAFEAARRTSPEKVDLDGVDGFWSLIALLGPLGAAGDIEALVRALAATTEDSILAFHHQLMTAVGALDTSDHANPTVFDLDSPPPGRSPAPADVFLLARVAVVAAGRDVYVSVLADPARLAGGWPLRAAQLVLRAAPAAFGRVTGQSWASHPARALPGREATADLARGEASSNPAAVPV